MQRPELADTALERVDEVRDSAAGREVHDQRTASLLGMALGVTFGICFLTGVWSHLNQQPPGWLELPFGPTGLYRVTQGLHVITGLISVPLLLAKLYSVSPQLISRPVVRSPLHLMERIGLLPLVGGSVFLLVTGAANIARWYPWDFFFPVGHYWAAWMVFGALLIHVALKVPVLRRVLSERTPPEPRTPTEPGQLTRRGLLALSGAAAAILTLFTAGQTVPFLRPFAFLAPRRPDIGSQGLPVNRTAAQARTEGLDAPDYRLVVARPDGTEASFTIEDLKAMPQVRTELPITCVEGWSAQASWIGVPVATVMAAAGLPAGAATIRSAQTRGGYRSSEVSAKAVADERCLLALQVNDQELNADHGAPLRLIAPNRPGVLQTKWVVRVEAR